MVEDQNEKRFSDGSFVTERSSFTSNINNEEETEEEIKMEVAEKVEIEIY